MGRPAGGNHSPRGPAGGQDRLLVADDGMDEVDRDLRQRRFLEVLDLLLRVLGIGPVAVVVVQLPGFLRALVELGAAFGRVEFEALTLEVRLRAHQLAGLFPHEFHADKDGGLSDRGWGQGGAFLSKQTKEASEWGLLVVFGL